MSKEPSGNSTSGIGKKGERIAADFLMSKGYEIILFNYRYRRAEIDIIACAQNVLVFVEVKYRTNVLYGYPEESVNAAKSMRIKSAAEQYIFEKNWIADIRFDIVAIVHTKAEVVIEHFEDCF